MSEELLWAYYHAARGWSCSGLPEQPDVDSNLDVPRVLKVEETNPAEIELVVTQHAAPLQRKRYV
jgi:hypothetical protein